MMFFFFDEQFYICISNPKILQIIAPDKFFFQQKIIDTLFRHENICCSAHKKPRTYVFMGKYLPDTSSYL